MYSIEDIQNYKIYVLGPSGSGKTVFLASLYERLAIPDPNLSFSLIAKNPHQRAILSSVYAQIANPGTVWPRGTQFDEVSSWQFTCRVKTAMQSYYEVLQFTYVDYAGGRLFELSDSVLENTLKAADALLGILDGWNILKLMRGELPRGSFFQGDLRTILLIMQESEKPAHFVITKWDLLRQHFSLSQVRDRLLEEPLFRRFVQWRNSTGAIIRLIPVSAVGFSFVEPQQNRDGTWSMRKKTNVNPQPFQVEMPLVCVLPDKFETRQRRLSQAWAELVNIPSDLRPNWTYRDRALQVISFSVTVVEYSIDFIVPFFWSVWATLTADSRKRLFQAMRDLLDKGSRSTRLQYEQSLAELKRQQEILRREVQDEQTALLYIIERFQSLEKKLEGDFPASRL